MFCVLRLRRILTYLACICILAIGVYIALNPPVKSTIAESKDFIKWVDFNLPYQTMKRAIDYDIASQEEAVKINWIDIVSYLANKYGNNFKQYKAADMDNLVAQLKAGTTIEELTKDSKYYSYYRESYGAALDEFVGEYRTEVPIENSEDTIWETKYGLKVFSPIASGYQFGHYDDFGNSRSYGFKRKHLGNDLMGNIGAPIIAVESGTVEAIGWNRYGGWRIGIRSFDKKRYYYYAHLRKDKPYHIDLEEGSTVKAGDVIGYLGMTGYSTTENVNNINVPHLHFGLQLIFDESQKEGNNEIWIDVYSIINLLESHKSAVYRVPDTKEYYRKYEFMEKSLGGTSGE